MKILGIDPGLATIGLGLIEANSPQELTVIDWLTITTPANTPLPDRLKEIHDDLSTYIAEHQPDRAVVETLFFETNVKTAIDVAQARGVILQTIAEHALELIEVSPMQLKAAITGDGNADKQQVQDMLVYTLKLDEVPQPDDAADALALAIYGSLQNLN